uniref:Putative secreted protein n=1 Tax=Anopheles triannulatus TaxID=58253 RepID=A0A2M4B2H2_9DIPT
MLPLSPSMLLRAAAVAAAMMLPAMESSLGGSLPTMPPSPPPPTAPSRKSARTPLASRGDGASCNKIESVSRLLRTRTICSRFELSTSCASSLLLLCRRFCHRSTSR